MRRAFLLLTILLVAAPAEGQQCPVEASRFVCHKWALIDGLCRCSGYAYRIRWFDPDGSVEPSQVYPDISTCEAALEKNLERYAGEDLRRYESSCSYYTILENGISIGGR
jgi:hypothetical protein